MKESINRMIKETLSKGLGRSNYDLTNTKLDFPKGGRGISQFDRNRGYRNAIMMLDVMIALRSKGDERIPLTPAGIDRYIDVQVAEHSFMDAPGMINNILADRSNQELIQEARSAIQTLWNLGGEAAGKADSYKFILRMKIGEE